MGIIFPFYCILNYNGEYNNTKEQEIELKFKEWEDIEKNLM